MALEFRLHSKEIHQNFIKNDELSNEIINALEQTRIEVKGSLEFKGIKKNLKFKHLQDLRYQKSEKTNDDLIQAFRYIAYEELIGQRIGFDISKYRAVLKNKLKNKYNNFFNDLKKNVDDQEKFTTTILEKLEELGLLNNKNDNTQNDDFNENEIDDNQENDENENQNNDESSESNIEMQTSDTNIEQSVSTESNEEMGDDSSNNEQDYFPKIESINKLENYKIYDSSFDEIINANELCDTRELDKLRQNLDQQVFNFQPLIVKIANRLQRKL